MTNLNKLLKYSVFAPLLFASLFAQATFALQSDLDKELSEYVEIFTGNNFAEQRRAIETLGWAGISSPELFDVVSDKLVSLKNADAKHDQERASWYAKTLALSGNSKYRAVLEDIVATSSLKKLRKYAKLSLERLPKYERWNPIISSGLDTTSEKLDIKRVQNMLMADDPDLVRLGTKRVYRAHSTNEALVGLVKDNLVKNYQSASSNEEIDAMAWSIRTLAESGDNQYAEVLSAIAGDASNKKIRKYAKKYSAYLN